MHHILLAQKLKHIVYKLLQSMEIKTKYQEIKHEGGA